MSNSLNFNNSFLINNQLSPFLVKGIYNNKEINYDIHFSLDNLILVNLKGSPKLIGNGSFGKVYLAKNKNDNKYYAIKHMIKSNLIKYLNNLEQIYNEINIQSRAYHPNIIQLFYVKETDEAFDLVLEYSKYGTLFDYMLKCNGFNENLVFIFFIQIVNAIKFLHENNVIHRDIKPENILLFDNYIVKLCDFGWSVKTESRLPGGSFSGTPEYMAPELINNEDYGKEIDIWMLGILLYELVHCFSPFRPKKQNFEEKELIDNIQKHEILFYMPCSDEYKELVFALLEPDVKKRFTIDDIYESKFVKKYENEESQINNKEYSKYSEEEKEKFENTSDNNNNRSFEKIEENNIYEIKKNLLANRYENNEELDDSKQILSKQKDNPEIILDNLNNSKINDVSKKVTKKESDRLTNSKFSNFDFKENNSNTNATEEQYEEKRSSPKNNNRNRKKKIKNNNIKLFEVNSDVNN
jgi:serine/threonine protein kinase